MTDIVTKPTPRFAQFRTQIEAFVQHLPDGQPFWSARDLQAFYEYSSWQKFERIITLAIESVKTAGLNPDHHFNPTVKKVQVGSSAKRDVLDYHVSQLGCYHLAMVADAGKEQAAFGRMYFTVQTAFAEKVQEQPALPEDPVLAQLALLIQVRRDQLATAQRVDQHDLALAAVREELDQSPIQGPQVNSIFKLARQLGQLMGAYDQAWRLFKNRFGLASYRDLPRCQFEEAVRFLQLQIRAYTGAPLLED